jgi:hypothetical protein
LPFVLLLAAACGGDDEKRLEPLGPPPVNPSLTVVGQGTIDLDIGPNASQGIDPTALLKSAGETTPCGRLVVLFTYRIDSSKDSVQVVTRVQTADVKVAEGVEGGASVPGCGAIAVQNDTDSAITGRLRYVLADTAPR